MVHLSLEKSSSGNFHLTNEISPPDVHTSYEQAVAARLDMYIPTAVYPTDPTVLIDKKCIEESRFVLSAIFNQTEWALSSKFSTLISFPLSNCS